MRHNLKEKSEFDQIGRFNEVHGNVFWIIMR